MGSNSWKVLRAENEQLRAENEQLRAENKQLVVLNIQWMNTYEAQRAEIERHAEIRTALIELYEAADVWVASASGGEAMDRARAAIAKAEGGS